MGTKRTRDVGEDAPILEASFGIMITEATCGDSAFIKPSDIPSMESALSGKSCGRFEARKIGRTKFCAVPVISPLPRVILLSKANVIEITNLLRTSVR